MMMELLVEQYYLKMDTDGWTCFMSACGGYDRRIIFLHVMHP